MAMQITIIGLGQIGASVGLALSDHKGEIIRVGHDRQVETARKAERIGAVDKVALNLHRAVEDADIVLLALPVDEIRSVLEQVAQDLKEEAVVLDTSSCMEAVSAWATAILPPKRFFVTLAPSLNPDHLFEMQRGIDAARADLFQKSLMVITCPPGTDQSALKLAADLTALLGAAPLFADAREFDGMTAATRLLPCLCSAALINATCDQPGWQEGRKLAGRAYAWGTQAVEDFNAAVSPSQTFLLNREHVLRVLDNLHNALTELRDAVAAQDASQLDALLRQAHQHRRTWLNQRVSNDYGSLIPSPEMPRSGEALGRLLGIRPRQKEKK
ncbi:MAG: prephenate dehydrogenase [Anaerolineae bacterium]|nr:prephenate dehydrogenase [Anaerolineae bacterium]